MALRLTAFLILILSMNIFITSCCDDCPTCPTPEEPVTDYDIYFSSYGEDPFYVYNTKEMAIVDTLEIPEIVSLEDFAVSGDGNYLITTTDFYRDTSGQVYFKRQLTVYDLETMNVVTQYNTGRRFEVSNTGRYIAVFGGDNLLFLDGTTFNVIFTDTATGQGGHFLLDDSRFYCAYDHHHIRVYDMPGESLLTTIEYVDNEGFSPLLHEVQPSADGEKLYFLASYGYRSDYVIAYIPEIDSTTLHYWKMIGGDIRLTPDGRQIIVTDPGSIALGEYGTAHVIFFEPETDAIISIVHAGRSIGGDANALWGFYPHKISCTPDSRYTIVGGGGESIFGMIDNELHRFVDIEAYELQTVSFYNPSCQKILK